MLQNKQKQLNIEIKQDMKILMEIERLSDTEGKIDRLSLNSYVEEVFPDGCFLIRVPIHKGAYYPFSRYDPLTLYVFINSRMFSLTVKFVEFAKQDNMLYAKVRPLNSLRPSQRRDCYRLAIRKPITAILPSLEDEDPLVLFEGLMLDLSDGGTCFVVDEPVEKDEIFTLTFKMGEEDGVGVVVDAEILHVGRSEIEGYTHKASARFLHHDKAQKERIFQFIMKQQLEIRSKLGGDTDLI